MARAKGADVSMESRERRQFPQKKKSSALHDRSYNGWNHNATTKSNGRGLQQRDTSTRVKKRWPISYSMNRTGNDRSGNGLFTASIDKARPAKP
jgi:hypothetical protein